MDTFKLYPTPYFRNAVWTEDVEEPKTNSYGEVLIGGGSVIVKKTIQRLEQKWLNSHGDVEWRPIKDVFLEEKCTVIKEESFMEALSKI